MLKQKNTFLALSYGSIEWENQIIESTSRAKNVFFCFNINYALGGTKKNKLFTDLAEQAEPVVRINLPPEPVTGPIQAKGFYENTGGTS